MNFSQGHSGTEVQCESCLFAQEKALEFTKMGEIHELFVLALSLVWFARATLLRFEGHAKLLRPHPFMQKTPTPPKNARTQKFGFVLLFLPDWQQHDHPQQNRNQGELKVTELKVTEKAQNADFRRKPQLFADSPLLLEIEAFGGRRRKPKIFAQKTAGNRRLGSVTLGPSPLARP